MGKITLSIDHDLWIEYLILCKRKGDYASNCISKFIKKELIKANNMVKKNKSHDIPQPNQNPEPEPIESDGKETEPMEGTNCPPDSQSSPL